MSQAGPFEAELDADQLRDLFAVVRRAAFDCLDEAVTRAPFSEIDDADCERFVRFSLVIVQAIAALPSPIQAHAIMVACTRFLVLLTEQELRHRDERRGTGG